MADPKDVERPASERIAIPTRRDLLSEDREELIERVQSLARELQRRMELEEEILHLKFQKGTASLQAQVEEASRRFRAAQQELEAFRVEILRSETDPGRIAARPFIYENLQAPPGEGTDPGQLRALLSVFRKLRGDRDRLQQEVEQARKEVEQTRRDLEEVRARCTRMEEEASALRARHSASEAEPERLRQAQAESSSLRLEQARLRESLSLEQEKNQRLSAEVGTLRERLADLEKRLEEALKPAPPPAAVPDGYELLQKFFERIGLKELLEKHIPGRPREGQLPLSEVLLESVGAIIAAQDRTLEAARELPFKIVRPSRKPELSELRQYLEKLAEPAIRRLGRVHELIRSRLSSLSRRQGALTVDLDSLEVVIGTKPRRYQAYWPLICFVSDFREFWRGDLRFSPRLPPKDVVGFLSACLSKLRPSGEKGRLRFRMDARFLSQPVLRLLEARRCGYVIAAPDSGDLRAAARLCSSYSPISDGWEAGEVQLRTPSTRATAARFAVLRHALRAPAMPLLPFLFRDPQYTYHVFAVDKGTSPWQALECYAGRLEAEESEQALLRDFCVSRLLGRGPQAHATCFQLYLLASNLLQWFSLRGGFEAGQPSTA